MTFQDHLAKAKNRPRPHKDVTVCIDAEIVEERDLLIEEFERVAAADVDDARLAAGPSDQLTAVQERLDALTQAAQDSLVELRFYRMPGDEWPALTAHHPVRVDVPLDRHYGYNFNTATIAAAKASGVRVEDGEEFPLTPEEWADLFTVISGTEVGTVTDAVWSLNEYEPSQRLDALVKGFGAATRSDKK